MARISNCLETRLRAPAQTIYCQEGPVYGQPTFMTFEMQAPPPRR